MPELPDVETFKRYLDKNVLHRRIEHIDVEEPRILEQVSATSLQRHLAGHRVEHSRRHGKYLFAGLDDGQWLVMHFGMTGALRQTAPNETEPRHTRLRIDFQDGTHLAYVDQRKLGRVALTEDIDAWIDRQHLGPDALSLSVERFRELIRSHGGKVKSFLMNQDILSGIGNIYSDEILFQARLHPETPVEALSDNDVKTLYTKMQEVLKKTIAAHAEPTKFPHDYLIPHRKKGAACPVCGGKVASLKFSGRTAYYCPSCQRPIKK